ncbi:DNA-3-methyladenine glycosylase family protein [Luteimicrobium subarcticum]|uniref:DNA-3-methyladenine glycosylase family protein n=1 Tax=Luteimicrobium subarcticum TaxID=620910 RepID=UPI001B8044EB|nr:DNA-3-methyladenine glycosylase 2 family protein [Luteimicrobium subarcticum]
MAPRTVPRERTVETAAPVDVRATLAPHARGRRDPAQQVGPDGAVWRATRTRAGTATLRFLAVGPRCVTVQAWGYGAEAALDAAPGLLGVHDDDTGFDPPPGVVRDAWRSTRRVRLTRSGNVLEALVPAVLEQRVQTITAHAAWRWLVLRHGEPAPGPVADRMSVPPSAAAWAAVPSWDFHQAGVDPGRARTVVACARLASSLQRAADRSPGDPAEARRLWRTVPGVGVWTAAETAQRVLGDPDAVSVGDFHLAKQIGWALTGERTDDDGMLALLEPYRGHRHRVVHHLLLAGVARAPRRGPRLELVDHRSS